MEIVADFKNALKFSCDSSCLFNVAEEAFPAVLEDIYVHPEQCYRLPSVVSAFASPMKYLLADAAKEGIRKGILVASFAFELVENLVRDIESDLSENISIQWKTNSATSVREDSERRNNRFAYVFLSIPPMEDWYYYFLPQEGSGKRVWPSCSTKKQPLLLTNGKCTQKFSIALLKYGINLSEIDELPPATISSLVNLC